jgi:N-acyl-D-amino-acid deacylase
MISKRVAFLFALIAVVLSGSAKTYDVIIRHGMIYDGSGKKPFVADVAIQNDSIAKIGNLKRDHAKTESTAPVLPFLPDSSTCSVDLRWPFAKRHSPGRHAGNFGEGESMGPLNEQGDLQ